MHWLWQELVKTALMGADRVNLSPEAVAALAALGLRDTQQRPQAVLEGAAVVHQLRRSALSPPMFEGPLPLSPELPETRSCSAQSVHHLNLILKGRFRPALEEFVTELGRHGRQFPPERLPELFDECLNNGALWEKMAPAAGSLGAWLIAQNPAWAPLAAGNRVPGISDKEARKLKALARAAGLTAEPGWEEALMNHWVAHPELSDWRSEPAERLMRRLPDPFFNRLLESHLKVNRLVDPQNAAGKLILLGAHHWEDSLTLVVVEGFQKWLAAAREPFPSPGHYRQLLRVAAYRSPFSLLERLRYGWPMYAPLWRFWENEVKELLEILVFRGRMVEAMSKSEG